MKTKLRFVVIDDTTLGNVVAFNDCINIECNRHNSFIRANQKNYAMLLMLSAVVSAMYEHTRDTVLIEAVLKDAGKQLEVEEAIELNESKAAKLEAAAEDLIQHAERLREFSTV